MKKLLLLLSILFICNTSFGAEKLEASCGASKPCKAGYYCTGAVGESESGVCVVNALNTTMCNFVDYIQKDIFKYIAIFAAVFGGIFMFVGKFTIVNFAQITVGLGVLYGAQSLIVQITGSNQGLCSASEAQQCLTKVDTLEVYSGYRNIRNLSNATSSFGENCGILGCTQAKCEGFDRVERTQGFAKVTECVNKTAQMQNRTIKVNIYTKGASSIEYDPIGCYNASFRIQCKITEASFERTYFRCFNRCTNKEFVAEAPLSLNIKSCSELVLKQISSN